MAEPKAKAPAGMRFWLMKTEPETFSIDDLAKRPGRRELWDGVRNYQARNYMRDEMRIGDRVLFYHSSCDPAGIAGLAEIVAEAVPDRSAENPQSPYHDPRALKSGNPWVAVTVGLVEKFPRVLTLSEMRTRPGLETLLALKKGMRLSIQPVRPEEYRSILDWRDSLAAKAPAAPGPDKKPQLR